MSDPSLQPADGEQEMVQLPPAPDAVSIDFSAIEGLPRFAQRRLWSISLTAALAVHALILLLVSWVPGLRQVGAGGTELEAIGVDIVSAEALESRFAAVEAARATPDSSVHVTEGSQNPTQASTATADQKPSEPDHEENAAGPKPDLVIPDVEEQEEPDEPSEIALAIADKQPDEPDVREPEPEPDRQTEHTELEAAAPSQPSEASAAAEEGGAAARGIDIAETPGQQAAGASAGVANAYAKALIETLARNKPRGAAGVRGTVRISFTVSPSGEVQEAHILQSSGRRVLDEAALTAVRNAKFPAPPPALANSSLRYEVPYIFR